MNEMQKAYLSKNVLIVFGRVTEDTFLYLHEAIFGHFLLMEKIPDLTLFITTRGGGYSLQIWDLLRSYPGEITGVVVVYARSAGAMILQACDKRLATPNSDILIHNGIAGDVPYDIIMDDTKLQLHIKNAREEAERRYWIFSERSRKTVAAVKSLCAEDRTMSVKEALEFGLLDGVISTHLPVSLEKGVQEAVFK